MLARDAHNDEHNCAKNNGAPSNYFKNNASEIFVNAKSTDKHAQELVQKQSADDEKNKIHGKKPFKIKKVDYA